MAKKNQKYNKNFIIYNLKQNFSYGLNFKFIYKSMLFNLISNYLKYVLMFFNIINIILDLFLNWTKKNLYINFKIYFIWVALFSALLPTEPMLSMRERDRFEIKNTQTENKSINPLEVINNKGKDKNLDSYLAGLWEGDGHIWIPKESSSKKHNPRFCITFHLKDKPLAEKLLKTIGAGFIRIKLKENACVLTVSPLMGLLNVINLLNGNLRTPKIYQLHLLIDWININHNLNIDKLSLCATSLNKDSWLAGFLDADGCFLIRYTKLEVTKKIKERISCSCVIEQRLIDPKSNESYFSILNLISKFLNTNLLITNRNYYRINATSVKSITLLKNYLENYSLRGSKYLDSLDWIETCNLIITKNHYSCFTQEGKVRIEFLKKRMNKGRILINWDHLSQY